MTKVCACCKIEKEDSEFYKHPKSRDGLASWCKACNAEARKRFYYANRKEILEKTRIAWEARKNSADYKSMKAAYQRKHRKRFPEIEKARRAIERGLKKGLVTKGPCEKCGTTERVQAHHDDYSKPLEVRWLCFLHHREHHGTFIRVV